MAGAAVEALGRGADLEAGGVVAGPALYEVVAVAAVGAVVAGVAVEGVCLRRS